MTAKEAYELAKEYRPNMIEVLAQIKSAAIAGRTSLTLDCPITSGEIGALVDMGYQVEEMLDCQPTLDEMRALADMGCVLHQTASPERIRFTKVSFFGAS